MKRDQISDILALLVLLTVVAALIMGASMGDGWDYLSPRAVVLPDGTRIENPQLKVRGAPVAIITGSVGEPRREVYPCGLVVEK